MLLVADHTKLWMCQRYKYFEVHQKKGRKSFQDKLYKHLSTILDGMDQKKTSIPYCFQKTKALADLVPYKTAVIGVIVHGFEARAYLVEPFWKHDSDLTIEIICRTLQRILEAGHPLAPVLYLQMDNCWRENKNQHVLTFLALLLKLRLFRKIKLNFDLVGHTHEDIDQLFRALNEVLKRKTIATVEDLLHFLSKGYHSNSGNIPFSVTRLDSVGGFKDFIQPLEKGMHNHILQHCFKV